ncbi:hypothetical protein AMTRI_Chr05g64570 [Amborella trichopoda]
MGNMKPSLQSSLNAKILGSGERTLILSNGFGSNQAIWQYILPHLLQNHRVVVYDMVGCGHVDPKLYDEEIYSSLEAFSDDLLSLLEELGVQNCVFLGHSMSGMIGCFAAIKRPEIFQSLILLGASPRYLNSEGYEGGFERSELESLFKSMESDYTAWTETFAPYVLGSEDPILVRGFSDSLKSMKPEIAVSILKTVFLSDCRDILPKLKVPCVLIQTRVDRAVPMFVAEYLKRELGGKASLEVLDVEGHVPHVTAPSLLISALDTVLPHAYGEAEALVL